MKTYEDGVRDGYRDGLKDGFAEGRKEAQPVHVAPLWVPTEPLPATLPPFYGPTWVGVPWQITCTTAGIVAKPDPSIQAWS